MTGNVIIRVVQFPDALTKGAVRLDANGDFNVYLNSRLNFEQQWEAALHEMRHILRNHFNRALPVSEAEQEAASPAGPPTLPAIKAAAPAPKQAAAFSEACRRDLARADAFVKKLRQKNTP